MKPEFIADFDVALRDLAGISVPGSLSFISQESITSCVGRRRNPFYNDILTIGTKDGLTIQDFFHLEEIPQELRRCPIYIHLDLSLNTDRSGLGAVGITSRKDVDITVGDTIKTMSMPFFSHLFSVAIEAPRGDKIPYGKIVEFILWLRKQKLDVRVVSRDQFQSEYVGELLEAQGFKSPKISLDRTPDGYIALRSVLLEQRIDLVKCQLLEDELIHLQRDSVSGRVDHPVGGSKDTADGLAGCVWQATMDNPAPKIPVKSAARAITAINGANYNSSPVDVSSAFQNLYRNRRK